MLSVTLQQKHNPALHSWNAPPCFWICTQEPGVLSKQETGISDKTFLQMKRRAKIHPPHKHTLTDGTFPLNGFVTYSEKTKPGVGGEKRRIFFYYYCRQQKHAAVQTNSWALAAAVWLQETGTSTDRDLQIFHVSENISSSPPRAGKRHWLCRSKPLDLGTASSSP